MRCFAEGDIYDHREMVAGEIIRTSYEGASIKARKQRARERKRGNIISNATMQRWKTSCGKKETCYIFKFLFLGIAMLKQC